MQKLMGFIAAVVFSSYAYALTPDQETSFRYIIDKFTTESIQELTNQSEEILPKINALMSLSPFQLMESILSDMTLREGMLTALADQEKGALFFQGFGLRMAQEVTKPTYESDLNGFCQQFRLRPRILKAFSAKNDWQRWVVYVLRRGGHASCGAPSS